MNRTVISDKVYYMSINQFLSPDFPFVGAGAVAFEREQMLQGLPAWLVYFDTCESNSKIEFEKHAVTCAYQARVHTRILFDERELFIRTCSLQRRIE